MISYILLLFCFLNIVGTTSNGTGIMFLNEAALGKEHHITMGDGSLKAAPKGYDSIVARGCTEPGTVAFFFFFFFFFVFVFN